MQSQLIVVFLAHALVLVGAHAQEAIDAGCERYASRIGVYLSCDVREFVEPIAPADIGLEAALAQRIQAASINEAASDPVPRPEDLAAAENTSVP